MTARIPEAIIIGCLAFLAIAAHVDPTIAGIIGATFDAAVGLWLPLLAISVTGASVVVWACCKAARL